MLRKGIFLAGTLMLGLFMTSCSQDSQDLFKNNDKTQFISKTASGDETVAAGKEDSTIKEKNTDNKIKTDESDETVKLQNQEASGIKKSQNSDTIAASTSQSTEPESYTIVDNETKESDSFYYEKLSDKIIDRITGKSYKKNCDIPYGELRYVRVLYWGFDEKSHKGELIVNKSIAEDIVDIFKELYHKKYPIEKMVLVDNYDADDNASMAADNTSSFNYRNVDGTDHLSMHSYGLAIDINPLYNPYVRTVNGKSYVTPKNGSKYADRSRNCPYYIDKDDACYKAFIKRGFTWGGSWKNSKDYQHFQKEQS